jgi:predicted RNase H-like HicB family nuclease
MRLWDFRAMAIAALNRWIVESLKRKTMRRICVNAVRQELQDLFTPTAGRVSIWAMIVPLKKVQLRQDEDGVWIAKSNLLPGCHAHGCDRGEALLRFQQAAKAHLEALLEIRPPDSAAPSESLRHSGSTAMFRV